MGGLQIGGPGVWGSLGHSGCVCRARGGLLDVAEVAGGEGGVRAWLPTGRRVGEKLTSEVATPLLAAWVSTLIVPPQPGGTYLPEPQGPGV